MNQEYKTYKSVTGSVVSYYKTTKWFLMVVDNRICAMSINCDYHSKIDSLEAGLELIGWVS